MGASSSVGVVQINDKKLPFNGSLYKHIKCGCVFCAIYEELRPYKLELALPCYNCLQDLRHKTKYSFDIDYVRLLYSEIKELDIESLINCKNEWMTEYEAIQYAKENRISIIELINSSYILKKFEIEF
jgi:hypothetical protein